MMCDAGIVQGQAGWFLMRAGAAKGPRKSPDGTVTVGTVGMPKRGCFGDRRGIRQRSRRQG